jgi:Tol biopolymer transport system component
LIIGYVVRLGLVIWAVFAMVISVWTAFSRMTQPPMADLLYSHNDAQSLYLWRADCASPVMTCTRERMLLDGLNIYPVAQWSPDGEYIAVYEAEAWAIYPTDCLLGDAACTPFHLDREMNDTRVAWGPDGSTLAYITGSSSATMQIITQGCWASTEVDQCYKRTVPIASKGVLRQLTWSADSSRFAFLGLQPRGLYALDAGCLDSDAGCVDQMQLIRVDSWPVYWPSLSADGRELLYFADMPDGVEQLFIAQVDAESTRQITFGEGGASAPAWSRDERYIAFAGFQSRSGGDLGIYMLDTARNLTTWVIHHNGDDFAYPSWNPRR